MSTAPYSTSGMADDMRPARIFWIDQMISVSSRSARVCVAPVWEPAVVNLRALNPPNGKFGISAPPGWQLQDGQSQNPIQVAPASAGEPGILEGDETSSQ